MYGFKPLSEEDKHRWNQNAIVPYTTPDGYLLCDIEKDIPDNVRENYFTGKIRYAVYADENEKVVFLLIKVGILAWVGFPVYLEAKRKEPKKRVVIRLMLQEVTNHAPTSLQKYYLPVKTQEYLEACAEIIEEKSEKDYLDRCRKVAAQLDYTSLAMKGIAQAEAYYNREKNQPK